MTFDNGFVWLNYRKNLVDKSEGQTSKSQNRQTGVGVSPVHGSAARYI